MADLKHAEEQFKSIKHTPVEWKLVDGNGDEEKGRIEAIFSTFNVMDSDGDIILSSAFTPNQGVPMVHAHDWAHIIGKGTVRVEPERAVFDGQLFLDTFAGMEAYKTIKNMGDLQEYSFGFRVLDYDIKEDDQAPWGYVRIIKNLELFEVSDVLKGASVGTRTLTVKHKFDNTNVDETTVIVSDEKNTTGTPNPDSQPLADLTSQRGEGMTFNDELDHALAAVEGIVDRAKSLADTRVKEGRRLSSAKRSQLVGLAEDLERQAEELRNLFVEKDDEPVTDSDNGISVEVLKLLHARQQREGFIPAD